VSCPNPGLAACLHQDRAQADPVPVRLGGTAAALAQGHAGCGKRSGETGRSEARNRAPGRLHRPPARFTTAQPWLEVFRLMSYAPELNPMEMSLPQCELRRSSLPWLPGSLSFEVPVGVPLSVQRRRLW
jgi:hypothetical protein